MCAEKLDYISSTAALEATWNLFFPRRCLGCDAYVESTSSISACSRCADTIYEIRSPRCSVCSLPREVLPGKAHSGIDETCGSCLETRPAFESAQALWEYDGIIAHALQRIKYGGDMSRLRELARMMRPWTLGQLEALHQESALPLLLAPVPMHVKDLRRRGYNAPALLLRHILNGSDLRIDYNLVSKTRRTRPQAGLTRGERLANLRHAFQANPNAPLQDRCVVLFDDVLTTGSTACELAATLKRLGCERVHILLAARATTL